MPFECGNHLVACLVGDAQQPWQQLASHAVLEGMKLLQCLLVLHFWKGERCHALQGGQMVNPQGPLVVHVDKHHADFFFRGCCGATRPLIEMGVDYIPCGRVVPEQLVVILDENDAMQDAASSVGVCGSRFCMIQKQSIIDQHQYILLLNNIAAELRCNIYDIRYIYDVQLLVHGMPHVAGQHISSR